MIRERNIITIAPMKYRAGYIARCKWLGDVILIGIGDTIVDAGLNLLCQIEAKTSVDTIMELINEPEQPRLQAWMEEHPPTAKDLGL